VLAALLAVAFGGVTARLGWLMIVRHGDLAQMADRQYSRAVVLPARRGPILDRHGAALATSAPADSLFAHPRSLGDPVRVAARLARVLDVREGELHALLTSDKPFVWIRRKLPPAVAAQVRALREPGLGLISEPLRLYPNRELAAHLVGFEGADGGLEGVERAFDSALQGTPGKAVVGRDALGRDVVTHRVLREPAPGAGVKLTIDTTIQYLAEREIDAAYRRTGSKAAMAIVMDPRTGDLLAVAIRPTFNPNTFTSSPKEALRDRAITDPFEPGSTFKIILAAAALEEGVVKPDDWIYGENGAITIAKTRIRDWKQQGWMTFSEVMQRSSNVGVIKVGLQLGAERYHRYMTGFGFGQASGLGLPGESRGVLRDPSRWSALSLPTMSMGQEVSVTAVQLVAAVGAVASGGVLMQPRLVQATVDESGHELRRFEPREIRRVISPETASTLNAMLVGVVESGTGHAAMIPGYRVAGKTGTAQKLDPATRRYSHAPGVLSFVGYVPAEDPRLVMLVMLDEPKNEKWGSEAAAPIFANIGRDVLRYLEVPPRDVPAVQIVSGAPETTPGAPAPVAAAAPEPASGPAEAAITPVGEATPDRLMPDLRGKTLRQALASLAPLGVRVDVHGRGRVTTQTPAPLASLDGAPTARLDLALTPPAPLAAAIPRSRAVGRPEGAVVTPVLDTAPADR
jgi:cell division protein FtsI (penicillin-binding protein 3)